MYSDRRKRIMPMLASQRDALHRVGTPSRCPLPPGVARTLHLGLVGARGCRVHLFLLLRGRRRGVRRVGAREVRRLRGGGACGGIGRLFVRVALVGLHGRHRLVHVAAPVRAGDPGMAEEEGGEESAPGAKVAVADVDERAREGGHASARDPPHEEESRKIGDNLVVDAGPGVQEADEQAGEHNGHDAGAERPGGVVVAHDARAEGQRREELHYGAEEQHGEHAALLHARQALEGALEAGLRAARGPWGLLRHASLIGRSPVR
mmetsp:Transcript_43931/g.112222  ORF Transcript_43931/g.112222 Transcript_43931/m.112222 type:complete len:263 (+) Transcript_43931:212-1000(+)